MDADRSLFEYQNKTNERIYKLQNQITSIKKKAQNLEKEVTADIEKKVTAENKKNEDVHTNLMGQLSKMKTNLDELKISTSQNFETSDFKINAQQKQHKETRD